MPVAFFARALAVALVAAFALPSALSAADANAKPNIVFIMADDLGYGDLGCYGQKRVRTPRIDRLAAEGLRFTQCYAGSTVCAPSRCALMTGKHTGHCRVRGNALVPLEPEDVTVAEVLKEQGYATGLVGKWGLGEPGSTGLPNRQGFDSFFGYLNQKHAHDYYPDYLWRNETKVALEENVHAKENVADKRVTYSPDLVTTEALQFIEQHREGPFFLYLTYTLPHANNERGKDGMEIPSDGPYSDEKWPEPQRNHAAMITRLDRDVGRVLDRLHELGLDERTLVFFTSDNGPHKEGGADPLFFQSAGPLRGHKRDLTDGGIRVPMIARWPGQIRAGTTTDQVCEFWDVLPTLADVVHAPPPAGIDGISLVPTLLGRGEQKQHEYLYWEFHEGGSKQALRLGPWKAIRNKQGGPMELYNVVEDPHEDRNVAGEYPEVVAKAEGILAEARTESAEWPLKGGK